MLIWEYTGNVISKKPEAFRSHPVKILNLSMIFLTWNGSRYALFQRPLRKGVGVALLIAPRIERMLRQKKGEFLTEDIFPNMEYLHILNVKCKNTRYIYLTFLRKKKVKN